MNTTGSIQDHPLFRYLTSSVEGLTRDIKSLNAKLVQKAIKLAYVYEHAKLAYWIAEEVENLSDTQTEELVQTIIAAQDSLVAHMFAMEIDISARQQYRLARVVVSEGNNHDIVHFAQKVDCELLTQELLVNTVVEDYNARVAADLARVLDGQLTEPQVNDLYEKVKEEGAIEEWFSLAKNLSALNEEQIQSLGRLAIESCDGHSIETAISFAASFRLNKDPLEMLVEKGIKRISHWHKKRRLESVRGLSDDQLERIDNEIEA